jgi:hypothetical protein
MVFGNASVSEFKFDRNTSAIVLMPEVVSSRITSGVAISASVFDINHTSTGDMVDGFGVRQLFSIKDNANVNNTIARLGAVRSGADNSGRFVFETATTGTMTEKMTIMPNGNVGIGTATPTDTLQVNGAINIGTNRIYNGASADSAGLFISSNQLNLSGFSGIIFRSSNAGTQSQTERMRITSDGKVGIGTSTPTLTGYGTELTLSNTGSEPEAQLNLQGNKSNDTFVANINLYNLTNRLVRISAVRNGANNSGRLAFRTNNAGTETEKMTILANGNVGIGTATPSGILHLLGSNARINANGANASGVNTALRLTGGDARTLGDATQLVLTQNLASSWYNGAIRLTTTETSPSFLNPRMDFLLQNTGTFQEADMVSRMAIISNGNVGINETSPTAQLQVKSGATDRVPLIVDTLASHTEVLQQWRVNGSQVSRIDVDGALRTIAIRQFGGANNALIDMPTTGTTISRNVADSNPSLIVNQVNTSSTGDVVQFKSKNNLVANIANQGNTTLFVDGTNTDDLYLIYKGSSERFLVDNDGDVYNTNGVYGTFSDSRIKENVVEARNYLEDVMKLRVVKYSLKDEKSTEPTKLGFIAQEFEQVFPKMVDTKEQGDIKDFKSIKMSVLIPMLVKTIQELKKEIDELKGK